MTSKRVKVLGMPVDCVSMAEAVHTVDIMVAGDHPNSIIAINPEKIIKATQDTQLVGWLNKAGLVIPDGIGVVVAVKLLNNIEIERVPGSELMPAICQHSVEKGYKLFLYGASPETIEKAVKELNKKFPGIQIVGFQHGYLPEEQMPDLIDKINQSKANILFIGLGSPKQELWMDRYLGQLDNIRVCQGVGGTFDVIAGVIKRAPPLFIKLNCEWLYRLLSQPGRLMRQTALPIFSYKLLMVLIRKK